MKSKTLISMILICLLCLMLSVMTALPAIHAASAESAEPGELLIESRYDGQPLSGIQWSIYYIGGRSDKGELVLNEKFSPSGVSLEELDEESVKTAAAAISQYIADNAIEPDFTRTSDENGLAKLEGAATGVYFIDGTVLRADGRSYVSSPAIVELKENAGKTVIPKLELHEDGTESGGGDISGTDESQSTTVSSSDTDESSDCSEGSGDSDSDHESDTDSDSYPGDDSDSNESGTDSSSGSSSSRGGSSSGSSPDGSSQDGGLPQTGQLWWPVPILSVGGLSLIALGVRVSRRKGRQNEQ